MGWILARRIGAVMAAETVARNIDVIEVGRQPCNSTVAIVAIVAAGDVVGVLAFGYAAIMACRACTEHLGVIHQNHRDEYGCAMAVFANIRRQRVRRTFTGRSSTVMAVDAAAGDARVIKIRR